MRNITLSFFLLVGLNTVFSQQNPISNFYQFNEYLLNPAEAGSQNKLEGTLSHRLQWRGIQGAPETSFLGVHGALNENMGIGGRLIIDKADILQQFSGAISYSYRIDLGESRKIHFGISAMGMQNNIRFGDIKITDQSDELINSTDVEGFVFDAEAGITLELNQLRIGFSSAHLLESGVDFELTSGNGTFDRARSFNAYVSYFLNLTPDWKVEPMVIIRNQRVKSFQLEFNALLSWQEKLYLGAGYRDQAGFIAKAGFQITDHILVAYAYEFSNTGIASNSSGSHEFMLGYRIPHAKKEVPEIKAELLSPIAVKEKQEPIKENELQEKITEEVSSKETITVPDIEEKIEVITKTTENLDTVIIVPVLVEENIIEKPTIQPKKIKESKPKLDLLVNLSVFDEIIYFEFNQSELSNEGKQKLQNMIQTLNTSSDIKINLAGHTCSMGDDPINRILSLARANSVKDYLISKGVEANRLFVVPMLDREPAVLNDTFDHRKKNRRVEFELSK